jgi:hypothetical protein
MYGCETWSLTLREGYRLKVFENRVLRRIFGPKRDEVTGEWRKLHSEELHNLYSFCPCSDDPNRFAQLTRLLSACEYLWLICFLPKETQLLISVYDARRSQTPFWKLTTSVPSSGKPCNYVHKCGTFKSCRTQNIIFIQQNWAEKISVLHYFLGAPRNWAHFAE